jgi:WD40 repeat protein
MNESDTLFELLLRYEEAVERGESPTLEALCAERPDLIESVRQRIGALAEFHQEFDDPDTVPLPAEVAGEKPPAEMVIAGYVILETIGRGGMAVVYRAVQPGLNREVALKMMHTSGTPTPAQRSRLRLEAEAIARLKHPNIVQIFEVGTHDGDPFLALEYCREGSLARRLRERGPMSAREAATCVRDLARGIAAAHAVGIVHRDLKPANVLCEGAGYRITDFGLATDEAGPREREGTVAGTPAYMAPEQAEGRTRDIGPPTDIYALGAVLYECLTGKPPHAGLSVSETLGMARSGEPLRPRELRREVPRDLETICLKCLERDPTRRYASAAGLADDLERFLDGRPVLARPVGALERAWRFCKRYPVQVGLAAGIILSLAAGVTAASTFAVEAQRQAGVANDERDRAQGLARSNLTLAEERRLALIDKQGQFARAERERDRAEVALYASQLGFAYAGWRRGDLLGGYPRPTTERPGGAVIVDPLRPIPGDGLRELLGRTAWDRQDWEYNFLAGLAEPCGPVLRGMAGQATVAGFSPDGQLLVVGGGTRVPGFPMVRVFGEVRFFDATTGELVRSAPEFERPVTDLVFQPDGRHVLVASDDGVVRVIDSPTARIESTLRGARLPGPGVASLGPDRAVRVGAGERAPNQALSGEVIAWDLTTGKTLYHLADEPPCFAVTAVPDGSTFFTSEGVKDGKGRIAVRDGVTGKVVREWSTQRAAGRLVLFPEQGVLVTAGRANNRGRDGDTEAWDVATGTLRYRLDAGLGVAPTPAGRLFTLAFGGEIRLWEAASGRELGRTGEPVLAAAPLAWAGAVGADFAAHPDGVRLAILDRIDRVVSLLDTGRDPQFRRLRGKLAAPVADGNEAIVVGVDDRLRRVRLADGRDVGELSVPRTPGPGTVNCLALSPDGKRLAVGTGDRSDMTTGTGEVQVWDLAGARLLHRLEPRGNPVLRLAWSPDGKLLAGVELGDGLSVWDTEAGKLLHGVAGGPYNLGSPLARTFGVAFSADGKAIVHDAGRARVSVVEARTGRLERAFGLLMGPAELSFHEDGKQILAAGGSPMLWDRATGAEVQSSKERFPLFVLAHDAPRHRLAGAGLDGVVQIREPFAAGPPRMLEVPAGRGRVQALAFAADGKTLAGAIALVPESLVVLWDLETGKIRQRLVGLTKMPNAVLFAPDGTVLAAGEDGEVLQWNLEGKVTQRLAIAVDTRPAVVGLDSAPTAGRVVAATRAGAILCWTDGAGQARECGRLPGIATSFAVAPDGKRIVAAGGGPTVIPGVDFAHGWLCVHDLDAGKQVWQQGSADGPPQPLPRERVVHLTFSATGDRVLALAGPLMQRARTLVVHAADTGSVQHRVEGPGQQLTGLTAHPDGRRALVLGERGTVLLVDLEGGTVERTFSVEGGGVLGGLAINAAGTRVVAGAGYPAGPGPHLVVWDTATGDRLLAASSRNSAPVAASTQRLWFSGDGQHVVAAGTGEVAIWEGAVGLPGRRVAGAGVACWSADGKTLVASVDAQGAGWSLRDPATGKERLSLRGQKGEPVAAGFVAGSAKLATLATSRDGTANLAVWDTASARAVTTVPLGWRKAHALAVHPTGDRLALAGTAGDQRGIVSIRTIDGKEVRAVGDHEGPVLAVGWSPDGKILASAGADGQVILRNGDTLAEVRRFRLEAGATRCLVFTGDGRLVIGGGGPYVSPEETGNVPDARPLRGVLTMWNLDTGESVLIASPSRPVVVLALSPDGKRLASASAGDLDARDELRLSDLASGRVLWSGLEVGAVRSLAFHPSGPQILVGTSMRTVLYDLSGKALDGEAAHPVR